jgi:hypothetical protein
MRLPSFIQNELVRADLKQHIHAKIYQKKTDLIFLLVTDNKPIVDDIDCAGRRLFSLDNDGDSYKDKDKDECVVVKSQTRYVICKYDIANCPV